MKNLLKQLPLLIALFLLGGVFALQHGNFLTWRNLVNILEQNTINALLAFGMTFVILLGGIDLSVGSVVAFAGLTAVFILDLTGAFLPAVAGGIVAGTSVGVLNGTLIAYARLPPFIVTLGTMSIARGLAFLYTSQNWGEPLYVDRSQQLFSSLASYQICYLAVFFLLAGFLFKATRFGHYVYAIGGNREAARFTGLPIQRIELLVYALSGCLAGVAGVINASLLLSGDPSAGGMYELNAIAAVVVGGTSFTGGIGTLSGTAIGALIMGILGNGLNLIGLHFSIQHMVKGAVILLAVSLDVARRRGKD